MLKNIYNKFSLEYRRLLKNLISLTVLQVANYVLPLATVPYLVRVLGPEKYGLISFAQALIQYFILFTDYGFNLSATSQISIYRDDNKKVSQIFSAVMYIKIFFTICSALLLLMLISFFTKFRVDYHLYWLTFGMVIGNVIFPVWYFQGIERMSYISMLNIIAKVLFTAAIFIFVRYQSDFWLVPLFNSLGFIITGIISIYLVFHKFKIRLSIVTWDVILQELKNSWHIFISNLSISLFNNTNTFLLGLFFNNIIVGYFSAGEKIIKAISAISVPISQAIYPYVSKLAQQSKEQTMRFLRKITLYIGSLMLLLTLGLFCGADILVKYILGPQYINSIQVIRIMSVLPVSIFLNNIFGTQIMLNFNMKQAFSRIFISAGIINLIMVLFLSPIFKHIGVAFAISITEFYVWVMMYVYISRKGYSFFKNR